MAAVKPVSEKMGAILDGIQAVDTHDIPQNKSLERQSATANYPKRHLFTLSQWHLMGEANVFDPDSRLDLTMRAIRTASTKYSHC